MGAIFKKSESVKGKWKEISCINGSFVDPETGEEINIAEILEQVYGSNTIFSLSTSNKVDVELV